MKDVRGPKPITEQEQEDLDFRWVDNIKMDLRAIGWDGMEWINLA
jgi:hypothetical protein